jgi:hypothetical protein
MSIALAATWHPRGEQPRFLRLLPVLQEVYASLSICLPPGTPASTASVLVEIPGVRAVVSQDWSGGRHQALAEARQAGQDQIHYMDFDRLLRWVETRPEEWRTATARLDQADCVVMGRTEPAYATHPQALVRTEALSNAVISHLLGRRMDVSAGSKGFSRRAVDFLLENSPPGRALGTDGEWPVLLHRAGFTILYFEVDGLDWESADRYQDLAAGLIDQRRAAAAWDADPKNWAHRLEVAREIIESGIAAATRPISGLSQDKLES